MTLQLKTWPQLAVETRPGQRACWQQSLQPYAPPRHGFQQQAWRAPPRLGRRRSQSGRSCWRCPKTSDESDAYSDHNPACSRGSGAPVQENADAIPRRPSASPAPDVRSVDYRSKRSCRFFRIVKNYSCFNYLSYIRRPGSSAAPAWGPGSGAGWNRGAGRGVGR